MKIWAFPAFYPYDYPGERWHGIFAHRQYKGLIENGADLEVIQPINGRAPFPVSELHPEWKILRKYNYPSETVYDGIKVNYPKILNFKPNRFVKKTHGERYVDAIIKFFKKKKIKLDPSTDIFYSQWLPDCVLVQEAAHRLGVKSAILCIGDDVLVWPGAKEMNMHLFKQVMREADYRFVCADYLGREMNKILGEKLPYNVVYMGVEHDYFKPFPADKKSKLKKEYNIPLDKTIILTIGTAIKRKGWLDLFDALKKVKESNNNFYLVAVHSGPPEFDLNEEAAKRSLSDQFLNFGEVRPGKINELYNIADIFCLPSHWEGLANVVVEAAASGLPVITTDVCGHPELITSGVNGILIPPKQPDVLAGVLLNLLTDKTLRTELGNNARDFMVHKLGNFKKSSKLLYDILTGNTDA